MFIIRNKWLQVFLVTMLCCRSRRRMATNGEKRDQTNRVSFPSINSNETVMFHRFLNNQLRGMTLVTSPFSVINTQKINHAWKQGWFIKSSLQRSLFSLMFARLDEFDSLTPLIITPSSASTTHSISIPPGREGRTMEKVPILNPITLRSMSERDDEIISQISPRSIIRNDRSSSNSPPPPRRPISAKTLIVPLNASRCQFPYFYR